MVVKIWLFKDSVLITDVMCHSDTSRLDNKGFWYLLEGKL
jgi:hypothetical protein